jgi:D-alanyl-D-alanine carboxypeptidase
MRVGVLGAAAAAVLAFPVGAGVAASLAVPAGAGPMASVAFPASVGARRSAGVAAVKRGLEALVAANAGPPGAIATLYRNGHLTTVSVGRADVDHPGAPLATDHMRIASVSKAFSGAVVLHLVQQGLLGLSDTIGERLPSLPADWGAVTVREMLDHTSGLPDYTQSEGFKDQVRDDPTGFVGPSTIISWVRSQDLDFTPGSRFKYSNTDNIVLAMMAESVTGESYATLLSRIVFGPAKLHQTSLPTTIALPEPFIHGYSVSENSPPLDVTAFLSPSGAWASGGIASTPTEMGTFMRDYLARTFFGRAQQQAQLKFVAGQSSPAGPGVNSAGLGIFRYRTRCGTVYGHTGNFPGYTQFAAATRNGKRSVTTTINIPAPSGALLAQLRSVQTTAVCALLRN